MARKPRDTVTYELKDGRSVVYRGVTSSPERREQEHRNDGKRFSKLLVTSPRLTEDSALKREAQSLKTYRDSHGGRNPKYNETDDG